LIYPADDERVGEPILNWEDKPIGEEGVVFWNAKDSCWQAAASDATHVIIVNQVSEHEATLLLKNFTELGGPEEITLAGFKEFLAYASSIGLSDVYQSDRDYVQRRMTPVLHDALQLEYNGVTMGFVKRDDRDVALALFKEDPLEFINAEGVTQEMPNGGVIVQLGDVVHAVQPDIFKQTYRLAEAGKKVEDLATDIESAKLISI
jgi:hypothetical protein